jgi:hypothetical protein
VKTKVRSRPTTPGERGISAPRPQRFEASPQLAGEVPPPGWQEMERSLVSRSLRLTYLPLLVRPRTWLLRNWRPWDYPDRD